MASHRSLTKNSSMTDTKVEPFLKWAGGKRWLTKSSKLAVPEKYASYYEPFLGGGAVFFHLQPESGLVSDKNPELANLYAVIRDHPGEVRSRMEQHQVLHSKEHYYNLREQEPTTDIERAVRFLYLNRACWNGLYRVNQRGRFNVPKGTKKRVVFDFDNFDAASKALKKVNLLCSDFECVIDQAQEGDFLFVDPPYTANHNFNGFLRYNEQIFSWDDQERLYAALVRACERGCLITVTNADHESVRNLYANATYKQVSRASVIAGIASKRNAVTEAIFTFNH